jgi:hypothetical protein
MVSLLPARLESDDPESRKDRRSTFINKLINWTLAIAANQMDKAKDTSKLHIRLSQVYEEEGNMEAAQRHLKAAALLNQRIKAPIKSEAEQYGEKSKYLEDNPSPSEIELD